jgi:hypothetical protein
MQLAYISRLHSHLHISVLKMDAACSSEVLVSISRTTQCHSWNGCISLVPLFTSRAVCLCICISWQHRYSVQPWAWKLYVGSEVLTAVIMKSYIFWDITWCGLLKVNEHWRNMSPEATLLSCLAYSSTLKMEAICSSETSVDFQWTVWRRPKSDFHIFLK